MDNLAFGLQTTALGMGIVFGVLILLWLLLTLGLRLERRSPAPDGTARGGAGTGAGRLPGVPVRAGGRTGTTGDLDPALVAAITVAVLRHTEARRLQAAPAMRSYWPGSLLFASRWVAAGRTRQAQSWRRR